MRVDHVDVSPPPETVMAVILGAVLATFSVIIANQLEAFFRRRERERGAALLMGEVLSGLRVILTSAAAARTVGDPYGPITYRTLEAARRELTFYERNREALLDIKNHRLRVEIHSAVIRIAMPLDGLMDARSAPSAEALRDQAFNFMIETVDTLPAIIRELGRIARYNFDHYQNALRPGEPGAPPAGAIAISLP